MIILLIIFHAKQLPVDHPASGTGNARLLEQRNNVKSHKIEPKVSSIVLIQTNSTPLLYGKKAQKKTKENRSRKYNGSVRTDSEEKRRASKNS